MYSVKEKERERARHPFRMDCNNVKRTTDLPPFFFFPLTIFPLAVDDVRSTCRTTTGSRQRKSRQEEIRVWERNGGSKRSRSEMSADEVGVHNVHTIS